MIKRYRLAVSGALVIALLATLLYAPFLHNAVVFDDHGLFTSRIIFDYAQTPFDFRPRTFPYFTLGLIQVLFGGIEANRVVSLVLHILCAWMLFALINALLRQALTTSSGSLLDEKQISTQTTILALIGAAWFALNPVAVYGAGYLAQRTILFATLFSLLSLWFYRRAFAENRTVDVITAALFYSAAVFSKEHAVMLPLAAVAVTTLYSGDLRSKIKRAGLYLALCLPAAITAVLAAKTVIASTYEPDASAMLLHMPKFLVFNIPLGHWPASVVMQMGFFFDYIGYWIMPDIRFISADMRFDFVSVLASWWIIPKASLFIACPIVALYMLRRGGLARLFACGLLYSWLLFFTELVSVRFQEPFVLYRSYLWAPGYVLMLASLLIAVRWKVLLGLAGLVLPLLFFAGHNRLQSFSNEFNLWGDAANKLPSKTIPGANRILYNRGKQYFERKEYAAAVQDFTDALTQEMYLPQIHYIRGIAYFRLQDYARALSDFDQAMVSSQNNQDTSPLQAQVHHFRGLVFEQMGCLQSAEQAYLTSLNLGLAAAQQDITRLNAKKNSIKKSAESQRCSSQTYQ
jgi:hypothetical protein